MPTPRKNPLIAFNVVPEHEVQMLLHQGLKQPIAVRPRNDFELLRDFGRDDVADGPTNRHQRHALYAELPGRKIGGYGEYPPARTAPRDLIFAALSALALIALGVAVVLT